MPELARLDIEPPEDRGLDVLHGIRVPPSWLLHGAEFECTLPRRLRCAHCEGGGCDACERRGAVEISGKDEELRTVVVRVGKGDGAPVALRLLKQGAASERPSVPRGCLVLQLTPGEPSSGVREVTAGSSAPTGAGINWPAWTVLVVVLLLFAFLLLQATPTSVEP